MLCITAVMRRDCPLCAMPFFDFYIMVDWSSGARLRGGRSDTIWIAYGPTIADAPLTDSPSRTEAKAKPKRGATTSRHVRSSGNCEARRDPEWLPGEPFR